LRNKRRLTRGAAMPCEDIPTRKAKPAKNRELTPPPQVVPQEPS
jgi:hypothetical protein